MERVTASGAGTAPRRASGGCCLVADWGFAVIEILVLIWLVGRLAKIAKAKGLSGAWGALGLAMWIGGQVFGLILGAAIVVDLIGVYIFALMWAIAGGVASYAIVKRLAPAPGFEVPPVPADTQMTDSQADFQESPADSYADPADFFAIDDQPDTSPELSVLHGRSDAAEVTPEQQAPAQPEQVIDPEASSSEPVEAPDRPQKRVNAKRLLVTAGAVIVLAAITGLLVRHNNGVKEAQTKANTAIAAARASIEMAGFAVEPGTEEVAEHAKATDTMEQAQASFAEGGFFKPSAFRQAADLAAKAEGESQVILARVDGLIDDAASLGSYGDTEDAFEAYFAVATRYPRAVGAAIALDEAEDLLVSQTDEGTEWIPRESAKSDLALMHAFLTGYPREEKPTAVVERAKARLLTEADDCISECESAMNANKVWSGQMQKRGRTSGSVVGDFYDQSVDGSDVKYFQELQALLKGLEQPGEMGKLFALLVDSCKLNDACRAIAEKPKRKKVTATSDNRWYSTSQVNKVKANATQVASKIAAAEKLLDGMKGD